MAWMKKTWAVKMIVFSLVIFSDQPWLKHLNIFTPYGALLFRVKSEEGKTIYSKSLNTKKKTLIDGLPTTGDALYTQA